MGMNPDLSLIIKEINKKHGDHTVVVANEVKDDHIPRFPSGSLTLDLVLGGGWPGNQISELIGAESSGKTFLALKTIAANQQRDPEFMTVWVAAEEWVSEYAEMCGVDPSRVLLVETNIMEHAYDAVLKFAESRQVDAIVVDSLPALVPNPEHEKTMEEMTVGRGALLTNKFFRKVGLAIKRSLVEDDRPILCLVLNQWRMKIGVLHGDPRTTPGGMGKDYAYFSRVELKRDDWIEVGKGENKQKVGQGVKARTLKNKSAAPNKTAIFDIYFAPGGDCLPGDVDFAREIVALAKYYGILKGGGGWYSFEEHKWQGGDAVAAAVREDLDLKERMEKAIRDIPTI